MRYPNSLINSCRRGVHNSDSQCVYVSLFSCLSCRRQIRLYLRRGHILLQFADLSTEKGISNNLNTDEVDVFVLIPSLRRHRTIETSRQRHLGRDLVKLYIGFVNVECDIFYRMTHHSMTLSVKFCKCSKFNYMTLYYLLIFNQTKIIGWPLKLGYCTFSK